MRQVVIQLARLGDVVQSLPLCRELRKTGPITLVLSFDPGEHLRREADEVVVLDLPLLAGLGKSPSRLLAAFRSAWGSSRTAWEGCGAVYCLNVDPLAQALARLIPAHGRDGAGVPGCGYHQWLHLLPQHRRENRIHLSTAMASLGGAKTLNPWPSRWPGLGPILLHPGSGSPTRRLPVEFWQQVVAGLLPLGRPILLSGVAQERALCADICSAFPDESMVESLCGETRLDELIELMDQAALLVAQDTGVLHVAAWRGTPVLGLYHASAWAWETGPWQDGALVLQAIADCGPCLEGASTCEDQACGGTLHAADVIQVAQARLRGQDPELPVRADCLLLRVEVGPLAPVLRGQEETLDDEAATTLQHALMMGEWTSRELSPGREGRLARACEDRLDCASWRRREWPRPASGMWETWSWTRETARLQAVMTVEGSSSC